MKRLLLGLLTLAAINYEAHAANCTINIKSYGKKAGSKLRIGQEYAPVTRKVLAGLREQCKVTITRATHAERKALLEADP